MLLILPWNVILILFTVSLIINNIFIIIWSISRVYTVHFDLFIFQCDIVLYIVTIIFSFYCFNLDLKKCL